MVPAGVRPTGEQLAVIDACTSGRNVVIEAGAGTGKTSTLQLAAAALVDADGLYLAYSKATATAAQRAFPRNVRCATAHSLAYRVVGYRYGHRLPGQAARVPAWAVANVLGLRPLPLGKELLITPGHQARIVMGTIERFCHGADADISALHVPTVNGLDAAAYAELTWHIVPAAQRAWLDIARPDGQLPFRHDHYLKLWQLSRPRIPASFIMFDEAQDANPVTVAILRSQQHAQQIIVGDSCQAIYGWRGAVDAMSAWPSDVRLNLTCSFRFGPAVAAEANKWLDALAAPYRLTGSPLITSVVGVVAEPQVILCRTNAETIVQARNALEHGQRVALASGARDIRLLAIAALDLQASGQTTNADLAAFRSWHAVQNFVRMDVAGADLAAGVRLIDQYGPAAVLTIIEKLSRERRADVVVSTAHGAKGREWERVLVAGDFRAPARGEIPRADAMLGYVAITRARHELDRNGLAWIDDYLSKRALPSTKRKEVAVPDAREANTLDASGGPRPYLGGRAQAESGSWIVRNDYDAWVQVAGGLPSDHPLVVQLAQAWRAVAKRGLDDAGTAAIRYHVLAHASGALSEAAAVVGRGGEVAALSNLARHARLHGERLQATADEMFLRSPKAGAYEGGYAQAESGSRIVEKDYRAWARTPGAALVAGDGQLRVLVKRLGAAWEGIRRHGIADGPGPASERYRQLAAVALELAGEFGTGLPSNSLAVLLQLASHAGKHAIRLRASAVAAAQHRQAPHEVAMDAAIAEFLRPARADLTETEANTAEGGPQRARRHERDVHDQERRSMRRAHRGQSSREADR